MDVRQIDESDNVTALELQKTKRVLHFSDGTMEEFSDSDGEETVDTTDMEVNIDVNTLPLVPRLKYQAYQAGCKLLSGIDYVGEGLANFLGITTPKYISESEMNAAYQGHPVVQGGVEEDNSIWNQNNNNAPNEVITRYPQPQSVYDVRNESEINCADDHKKHSMDIPYEWELQTTANCDCATFTAYPSEMRRRAYIVALTDKYDRNKRQQQHVTSKRRFAFD